MAVATEPFYEDFIISDKKKLSETQKKANKDLLDKKYAEESKLVKGIFKNLEAPGCNLEFAFKKYPQDPIRLYKFFDGKTYEIPLSVARHINNDCNEKEHSSICDADGNRIVQWNPKRQRYQFLSVDFM